MVNVPPVIQIVERCQALFEDLDLNAVKQWKAAVPGRKAIGYMPIYVPRELDPRRRHAAGGHPRRRRPARSDPGRRVLPELHLPHPALDDRARPHRPPRLPRRHAVPVDLRRDPQPLGHVADPVQGQVRQYFDVPQNYEDAIGGTVLHPRAARPCATTSAGCAARRSPTPSSTPRSRVYNENRRAVRELYAYRAAKPWQAPTSEVYLVLRAGMVLPPEEHTAARARLHRRGRRAAAAEARQRPRRADRRRSASSRRSA